MVKFFELIRGGGERERVAPKEERTYEEQMDELTSWNIEHTDILKILRQEINEERLARWSEALERGVRRHLDPKWVTNEAAPLMAVYRDLYRFVKEMRVRLLGHPSVQGMKSLERSDSLVVCILCGIRALQKERGAKRPIDTLQWMILERYLG
ncbi:MAG: hypothetical protein N3G78_10845 [Desulfobacterota bacterium]|nr:hypothetical protein [Thermodesulfobacteriota bacterium]